MIEYKSKIKMNLLILSLFVLITAGMLSTAVSASSNYKTTLTKGTEIFTVEKYDIDGWKTTVNSNTTPSDWFDGYTNLTGAQSKVTLKGWNDITWDTYDVFFSLFMREYFTLEDLVIILNLMDNLGYNETTINANYTNTYKLWYGLRAVWNFTAGELANTPSYIDGLIVFKNPLDFKAILDDYNILATELNGIFPIQLAGYNFPILNADDFLWQLVLNGLSIGKPQSDYLVNLIDELGCENVTVSGSSLNINRYGETDYIVVISYGGKGTMSSLLVKDVDENIIFQIVSTNSEWIFYTILIVIAICGVVLAVYVIIKKRKPKI